MKSVLPILIALTVMFSFSACQSEKTIESHESEPIGFTTMTVEELHEALGDKDFTLVNVHIPYAGELPGTDLFILYNAIEQNLGNLPADKNAELVLYCRSGGMSDTAAETLVGLGYRNVTDVPGGMNAWKAAGYEVLQMNGRE